MYGLAALDADMPIVAIPTLREYYIDLDKVLDISSDGPSKSFAFRRLQYLEGKWNLYTLLNEHQEMADSKVSTYFQAKNRLRSVPRQQYFFLLINATFL